MKKTIFLFILLLCGCSSNFDFKETREFKYINENVSRIDKIVVKMDTLIDKNCYLIDTDDGINMINQIDIDDEVEYGVTDSDKYYLVYFDDGTLIELKFSGEYFVYNDRYFELKREHLFFIDKVGVPKDINDDNVLIADKLIDCNKSD